MKLRLALWSKRAIPATLLLAIPPVTHACSPPSQELAAQSQSASGAELPSKPSITTRGPGLLEIFVIRNGLVAQRSFNGTAFSAWSNLPLTRLANQFNGQPVAVSWDSTRIDVFAMDDQGNLEHNSSLFGRWNPTWDSVVAVPAGCFNDPNAPAVVPGAGSYPAASGMAVASWGAGRLDVFLPCNISNPPRGGDAAGSLSTITQITYDNGWQAPRPILSGSRRGFDPFVSAVSWGQGRIDLVMNLSSGSDPSGRDAYHAWTNDGVNWNGPEDLGNGPSAVGCNSTISSWRPDYLSVLQVSSPGMSSSSGGPDGSGVSPLWLRALRNNFWDSWVPTPLPGVPPGPQPGCGGRPSSTSWGAGRIDLVYPADSTDGGASLVEHAWYNESNDAVPGTWGGPEEL